MYTADRDASGVRAATSQHARSSRRCNTQRGRITWQVQHSRLARGRQAGRHGRRRRAKVLSYSSPTFIYLTWHRISDCHLSATELSRLLHLACGTVCTTKLHLISHFHSGDISNILVSAIFSGRHRDTLVDLAIVFTALHGMQTRSCDENSVRPSNA